MFLLSFSDSLLCHYCLNIWKESGRVGQKVIKNRETRKNKSRKIQRLKSINVRLSMYFPRHMTNIFFVQTWAAFEWTSWHTLQNNAKLSNVKPLSLILIRSVNAGNFSWLIFPSHLSHSHFVFHTKSKIIKGFSLHYKSFLSKHFYKKKKVGLRISGPKPLNNEKIKANYALFTFCWKENYQNVAINIINVNVLRKLKS